ncbi:MAG: BrnT family toxin [Desulfobacula sp.]|uniref:BrnT family toxin n=1 Tax=Desulfobacula sp. TaxID=2593537 RepID=UPI0039B846A5|nr:BrnT family toxin [Desulfobacula sp.]
MKLNFEWDEEKAKTNFKKHGVSFEEAITVFFGPFSITMLDPDHSEDEGRYVDLGISDKGRVLVVICTERRSNIRIISCRKAASSERILYEKGGD